MKKVVVIFLVFAVVASVTTCVYASNEYRFEWFPDNSSLLISSVVPPEGTYKVQYFTHFGSGELSENIVVRYDTSFESMNASSSEISFNGMYFDLVIFEFSENLLPGHSGLVVSGRAALQFSEGDYFVFIPVEVEQRGLLDFVTVALDFMIQWIGICLYSLTTGSLNPLLVIFVVPIALALILFVCRVIKSTKGRT